MVSERTPKEKEAFIAGMREGSRFAISAFLNALENHESSVSAVKSIEHMIKLAEETL